ncbi:MAG: polysaccharide biosynthesis C-terminal domain-containing protein [Roseiarcus sp.]
MVFAIAYLGNAVANFLFGLAVGATLGPAVFGRYATAALAATVIGVVAFDWLRLATNRFWLKLASPERASASLEAGFLLVSVALAAAGALAYVTGVDFGLGATLVALIFALAIANARFDFRGARLRARESPGGFVRLSLARQGLIFTFVLLVAHATHDAAATLAALAGSQALASLAARSRDRARIELAVLADLKIFADYASPIVVATALFMAIGLVNREIALARFGAAATGQLALATDLSYRLFAAFNFLPETVLFQIAMRREAIEGAAAAREQIRLNQVYAFALIAPVAIGYMAMAPTFEALIVPRAFRGEFAVLARDLAPGFLAYCCVYAICNPMLQLARRTWPIALAALVAFASDIVIAFLPTFSHGVEGLALAHSASLVLGFTAAALFALARARVRPHWRDLSVIAISTAAMGLAIRPLNALPSAPLAAALAVLGGGALFALALAAFDVAGLRSRIVAGFRNGPLAALTAR